MALARGASGPCVPSFPRSRAGMHTPTLVPTLPRGNAYLLDVTNDTGTPTLVPMLPRRNAYLLDVTNDRGTPHSLSPSGKRAKQNWQDNDEQFNLVKNCSLRPHFPLRQGFQGRGLYLIVADQPLTPLRATHGETPTTTERVINFQSPINCGHFSILYEIPQPSSYTNYPKTSETDHSSDIPLHSFCSRLTTMPGPLFKYQPIARRSPMPDSYTDTPSPISAPAPASLTKSQRATLQRTAWVSINRRQ